MYCKILRQNRHDPTPKADDWPTGTAGRHPCRREVKRIFSRSLIPLPFLDYETVDLVGYHSPLIGGIIAQLPGEGSQWRHGPAPHQMFLTEDDAELP